MKFKILLVSILSTGLLFGTFPNLDICTDENLTIPTTECQALEALWDTTNGPRWTINTNWGTDANVSTWHKVKVLNGHVDWITVFDNNLTGNLPEALTDLTYVRVLALSDNPYDSSEIPLFFTTMTSLEVLNLGRSNLTGTISPLFSNLTKLKYIGFNRNNLTGMIPATFSELINLEDADFDYNNFYGPLPSLANMPNIGFVNIRRNNYTFVDLEENNFYQHIGVLYSNQNYDDTRTIYYRTGDTITIEPTLIDNPSGNDSYTWNYSIVSNTGGEFRASDRNYTIENATSEDEGYYNYKVTNTRVTEPSIFHGQRNLYYEGSIHLIHSEIGELPDGFSETNGTYTHTDTNNTLSGEGSVAIINDGLKLTQNCENDKMAYISLASDGELSTGFTDCSGNNPSDTFTDPLPNNTKASIVTNTDKMILIELPLGDDMTLGGN